MSNKEKAKELEELQTQFGKIIKDEYGVRGAYSYPATCDLMEKAYQLGQSQQPDIKQWVSVLDETPPFVEFVLCYSPNGSTSYRCFSKTHSIYYPQQWIDVLHVTHWQKPKPPNSTTATKTDKP